MQKIKCSRCGKSVETSDSWKYTECKPCHDRNSLRNKIKREIKQKFEELKVTKEIESGNLNYGLTPKYMSWDDYKKIWKNKKVTFKDYLEDKKRYGEATEVIDREVPSDLAQIPSPTPECSQWRRMCLGLEVKDRLFFGLHHQNCRACKEFYGQYRIKHEIRMEGVDLWGTGEPRPETPEERENRRLQRIMEQETFG